MIFSLKKKKNIKFHIGRSYMIQLKCKKIYILYMNYFINLFNVYSYFISFIFYFYFFSKFLLLNWSSSPPPKFWPPKNKFRSHPNGGFTLNYMHNYFYINIFCLPSKNRTPGLENSNNLG